MFQGKFCLLIALSACDAGGGERNGGSAPTGGTGAVTDGTAGGGPGGQGGATPSPTDAGPGGTTTDGGLPPEGIEPSLAERAGALPGHPGDVILDELLVYGEPATTEAEVRALAATLQAEVASSTGRLRPTLANPSFALGAGLRAPWPATTGSTGVGPGTTTPETSGRRTGTTTPQRTGTPTSVFVPRARTQVRRRAIKDARPAHRARPAAPSPRRPDLNTPAVRRPQPPVVTAACGPDRRGARRRLTLVRARRAGFVSHQRSPSRALVLRGVSPWLGSASPPSFAPC